MNYFVLATLSLLSELPPTGGKNGRDGPILMANDQIKDCSYWDSRIAEAQQKAQIEAKEASRGPASMREIHRKAARLYQAAIPKYQAEARACRQRAQKNAPGTTAPGAAGPGGQKPGGQNSVSQSLNELAQQLRNSGREGAANALEQLRARYEGGRYQGSGSSSGSNAVDTAQTLERQNTDELAPDEYDGWGSTYSSPPAKKRGPSKTRGNDPMDGRDLQRIIDFLPDDAAPPERFIDFNPIESPATAALPPPPDYVEQGYMDEKALAREYCEALLTDPPGPGAATSAFGTPLDEASANGEAGYPSSGFNPDQADVEALAHEQAKEVVREAMPERISKVLDGLDDPYPVARDELIGVAGKQGKGTQVGIAFGQFEGAMDCAANADGRCTQPTVEAVARKLPVFDSIYEAKDELDSATNTVSRLMNGASAVVRDAGQVLGKTADLGRAMGNLAKAKLFKMAGARCVYDAESGSLSCLF